MTRRYLRALALQAVVLAGCHEVQPIESVVVRDSSGVAIVDTPLEVVLYAPRWSLSGQPAASIGMPEGDSMYELYRVADAATLPDGNIAVINDREVRVYSPTGRFVLRFGRAGAGPGELDQPTSLAMRGDSLIVFDESLQRLSVFSMEGRFYRATQLTPASRNPAFGAALNDGSLLIFDVHYRRPKQGYETLTMNVTRHGADGRLLDSLPALPFAEMGHIAVADVISTKIFGAETAAAGYQRGYWVAEGPPVVSRYSPEGVLEVVSRWEPGDLRIADADVRKHVDAVLDRYPAESRPSGRRELESTAVADHYPATLRAIASDSGELWVERYHPYSYEGPTEWLVFDVEGVIRGRITLPERLTPLEVGSSHLLGRVLDDYGVERVDKYALRRSQD